MIARASGAGHGELRRQSGSDIVGGNFVPVAGNGKQANRCRAPWLWARNGLSRSAHVGESRRASIYHDAARGYRDHSFKGEYPFARTNLICTKRHSNPLSTWPKRRLIVCSGADAASLPCVRPDTRSIHAPPVWASPAWRPMQHGARRLTSAWGEPPACGPMADSPPARECRCRKLPFCPSTAQKEEAARASPTPKTISNSGPDDPGVSRAHRPSPCARH